MEPSKLQGCKFLPGQHPIHYSIISASLPAHVPQREEEAVKKAFPPAAGNAREVEADCAGNAITAWSGAFGASALGERGKPAEKVANEACASLVQSLQSGCSVDVHLADQLLLYAALAAGASEFSTPDFSSHLKTNADVVSAMTGRNIRLGNDRRVTVE